MFGLKKSASPGILGIRSFSTSNKMIPEFGMSLNLHSINAQKKFNYNRNSQVNPVSSAQNYCTSSAPMKIYKRPDGVDDATVDSPPSPICISLRGSPNSHEIKISITPESYGRKTRLNSDCASEDSFIIFDADDSDVDDDDYTTDESLSETDSDNEGSDVDQVDFVQKLPIKKVRFSDEPCLVHKMVKWSFAYRAARRGPWEEYARDRSRFKDRIAKLSEILEPILNVEHRQKIFDDRFRLSSQ